MLGLAMGISSLVGMGLNLVNSHKDRKAQEEANEKARLEELKLKRAKMVDQGADVYSNMLNTSDQNQFNADNVYYDDGGLIPLKPIMPTSVGAGIKGITPQMTTNKVNPVSVDNAGTGFDANGVGALMGSVGTVATGVYNMMNPTKYEVPNYSSEIDDYVQGALSKVGNAKRDARSANGLATPLLSTGGLVQTSNNTQTVMAGTHESGNDLPINTGAEQAVVEGGEVIKEDTEGLKVFSDRIDVPGTNRTFAEIGEELSKEKGKIDNINSPNTITNNTNSRRAEVLDAKLNNLFDIQESLKAVTGMDTGADKRIMAGGGGLRKWANADPSTAFNVVGSGLTVLDNIYNMFNDPYKDMKVDYSGFKVDTPKVVAQELETDYDVNPQLQKLDRDADTFSKAIDANVASSSQAISNKRSILSDVMDKSNQLYDVKNQTEIQLRNQNKLNRQGVDTTNAQLAAQDNQINANISLQEAKDKNALNINKAGAKSANFANLVDDVNNFLERQLGIENEKVVAKALADNKSDTGVVINSIANGSFDNQSAKATEETMLKMIKDKSISYADYAKVMDARNNRVNKNRRVNIMNESEYNKLQGITKTSNTTSKDIAEEAVSNVYSKDYSSDLFAKNTGAPFNNIEDIKDVKTIDDANKYSEYLERKFKDNPAKLKMAKAELNKLKAILK
jgi:hypothetical protein